MLLTVNARQVTTILVSSCLCSVSMVVPVGRAEEAVPSALVAHPIKTRLSAAKIQAGASHSPEQEEPWVPSGPSFFGPSRLGKLLALMATQRRTIHPRTMAWKLAWIPQPPLYVLVDMLQMFLGRRESMFLSWHVIICPHRPVPAASGSPDLICMGGKLQDEER